MARIRRKPTKTGKVRWQVLRYVRTEDGSLRERAVGTYASHREARRRKAEVEREGTPRDAGATTVRTLLDRFLEITASDLQETSQSVYWTNARTIGNVTVRGRRFGDLPVARVNVETVDAFLAELSRGRAPQTVRNLRSLAKRAFDAARRWQWIFVNPFADARPISAKQTKAAAWTLEELEVLREEAARHAADSHRCGKWGAIDQRIIEVLIATGMRREEVLGLTRKNLHLDTPSPRATIAQVCVEAYDLHPETGRRRSRGGRIRPGAKTEAGERSILLPPTAVAALRSQLAWLAELELWAGPKRPHKDLVFVDPETLGPMSPHALSLRLRRLQRNAGVSLAPSSAHGFRHSHGQILHDAGVPIGVISKRLGHAKETTTLSLYLRATDANDQAAVEVAERVFGRATQRDADLSADLETKTGPKRQRKQGSSRRRSK